MSLRGVEVLNFGVHGYGTDQMLLRWEREGVAYAPDVVVLAFAYYHLDRNITGFRFYAKPHFILEPGGALQLERRARPRSRHARAGRRSGATLAARRSQRAAALAVERELRRRDDATFQAEGPAWEVTRALITRFAKTAHEHGARMVLLNIDEDAPWLSEPLERLAAQPGRHVGGRRSGARRRRAGGACGCACPATRTGTRRAMP